ncbi:TPA: fimbria/pilus outer membrane usher protein [Salmonella enterica subsp. enterica serovar Infantis]|nr:fimbria/pilus outer membrane usher protein [Salmonella enterica subsp. enterica serovar Infantis]
MNHSSNGRTGEQIGISGSAGDDNQYNYGVIAMSHNQGTGSNMTVNGGGRSPYTNLTATYGTGKHYQNASVGMSGTVIPLRLWKRKGQRGRKWVATLGYILMRGGSQR